MRSFFLLGIVLALCSSVLAAGHIELRVNPDQAQSGYLPSTTITIEIYASGFYTAYPGDSIGFMDIAEVQTDNGGTASAPSLHSTLAAGAGISAGTIVNSGGVLIEDIRGYKYTQDTVGVYPFPAVLHQFEFHVPDLPYSTIIQISLSGFSLKNIFYNDPAPAYTVGEPLEIHVVPEPVTIALLGLGGLFLRRRK